MKTSSNAQLNNDEQSNSQSKISDNKGPGDLFDLTLLCFMQSVDNKILRKRVEKMTDLNKPV